MDINKLISRLFIFLYLAIPYLPLFGEIDRIASQWMILSFLNLISITFIFFRHEQKQFNAVFKKPIIFYLIFLVFGLFSIFKSVNPTESSVEFFRYFSTLMTIVVLSIFVSKKNNFQFLLYLFVLFCMVDVLGIYLQQSSDLPLIGFTGNKNIASASLILKSNAILFILFKNNNIFSKLFVFLFSFFVYSVVILIGSKAGILTAIIISSILLILSFIKKLNTSSSFIIIPLGFLASVLASNLFNNNVQEAVSDTINYVNDKGNTDRLRYYSQAIETFSKDPFLGIGLGNWKIHSSKYDSSDMINYIVQYHSHNDHIQFLAEIGIGSVFYLLFIISSFLIIIKNLNKSNLKDKKMQFNLLLICFLSMGVYFLDSNLNFPAARVVMQLNLASVIALILKSSNDEFLKS